MKVLQINSVCGTGSTGRIALDLYKTLEEHGHICRIAYGRGNAPKNIQTIQIGNIHDVYFHGVMSRLTDRHGFYSRNATKKLLKEIELFCPDIIHLHNIHGYYINVPLLFQYLKKLGKPVIWTLHDCWAFTGHCSHFQYVNCDRWESGCFECPQKQEYPRSLMDNSKQNYLLKKEIFNSLSNFAIVTPSQWLYQVVQKSFFHGKHIYHIPNGIDTTIFKQQPYKNSSSHLKTVVLGVANIWNDRKGFFDFIKLNELLNHKLYQIIMVGVNAKQKSILPPSIIGIEQTDSVDVLADLYSNADVYLNLTYEDNFPTTNLEALACGTPVITYKTGGSVESCTLCFNQGDLAGVAKAIQEKQYNDILLKDQYKVLDKTENAQRYLNLYGEMRQFK